MIISTIRVIRNVYVLTAAASSTNPNDEPFSKKEAKKILDFKNEIKTRGISRFASVTANGSRGDGRREAFPKTLPEKRPPGCVTTIRYRRSSYPTRERNETRRRHLRRAFGYRALVTTNKNRDDGVRPRLLRRRFSGSFYFEIRSCPFPHAPVRKRVTIDRIVYARVLREIRTHERNRTGKRTRL